MRRGPGLPRLQTGERRTPQLRGGGHTATYLGRLAQKRAGERRQGDAKATANTNPTKKHGSTNAEPRMKGSRPAVDKPPAAANAPANNDNTPPTTYAAALSPQPQTAPKQANQAPNRCAAAPLRARQPRRVNGPPRRRRQTNGPTARRASHLRCSPCELQHSLPLRVAEDYRPPSRRRPTSYRAAPAPAACRLPRRACRSCFASTARSNDSPRIAEFSAPSQPAAAPADTPAAQAGPSADAATTYSEMRELAIKKQVTKLARILKESEDEPTENNVDVPAAGKSKKRRSKRRSLSREKDDVKMDVSEAEESHTASASRQATTPKAEDVVLRPEGPQHTTDPPPQSD
ncbi:atherin-like [Schistocerca piceifrons]|uniref:atherin-like n=1 Tax=Schistocerca piceifrons TaxID=274613 RepID=UPI001F5F5DC6|nr:atherin-like [Schistocerca piceifrons]